MFSDIVRKNAIIRSAFFFYNSAPEFIKSYLLLLYGVKCYLSANCRGTVGADVAFFASYPNEQVAIAHVRRHLDGLSGGEIWLSRGNCFRPQSLKALPAFLWQARRLQRLSRRLVRRFHFLPACRIFSTITYYARFRQVLDGLDAQSVFVANHYSPECLALAAAAHRSRRRVFCTNHGNGTWRSGYVPPVHADLIAVTSAAILEAYARDSRRNLDAVFIPHASPQRPMRAGFESGAPLTVGIFLTALTNLDRLQALVTELEANPRVDRVLIRSHPVKVVNDDLSALLARGDHVGETGAMPLAKNIELCDIAICGNSTVTVDLLRGGLPVVYDAGLDDLADDVNGYVQEGLLPPLPAALDRQALASLAAFYSDPAWAATMRHFDAGYRQDEAAMLRSFNGAVRRVVRAAVAAEPRSSRPDLSADASEPANAL
ncbi:MAG TPA: hypothetical protein EYH07_09595 [Kiloniellaceae bacterium]|nr:hypothetical protein [Kiloniellaceae bacterium]